MQFYVITKMKKKIHRNKNYASSFVLGTFYSMNVRFKNFSFGSVNCKLPYI